jgi:hypothetical protein
MRGETCWSYRYEIHVADAFPCCDATGLCGSSVQWRPRPTNNGHCSRSLYGRNREDNGRTRSLHTQCAGPITRRESRKTREGHLPGLLRGLSWQTALLGKPCQPLAAAKYDSLQATRLDQRIDNETPSFAAFTVVAPGERFSVLAILTTPALALAICFKVRMSSLVQGRKTNFFFLGIQ